MFDVIHILIAIFSSLNRYFISFSFMVHSFSHPSQTTVQINP